MTKIQFPVKLFHKYSIRTGTAWRTAITTSLLFFLLSILTIHADHPIVNEAPATNLND